MRCEPGDELIARDVFEKEAAGSGTHRLVDVLVQVEGGQDQYTRLRSGCLQAACCFDAIEFRHADVHDDDVWFQLAGVQPLVPAEA